MAFQTGTQIRPELANADYSGFVNAANIRAQAMMNLGEQIGGGIKEYQKNKTITATSLAQLEALAASNPDAYAAVKSVGGKPSKSISNIEKGDYKQVDALVALGAMQTYVNDQARQRQVETQEIEQKVKLAQLANLEGRGASRGREVTPEEFAALSTTSTVKATPLPSGNYLVEEVTAKPPTGAGALSGKPVTMEEIERLRGLGYDPTVEFDASGQPRLTKMSAFSPQEGGDIYLEGALKTAGEAVGQSLTKWQENGSTEARKNLRSMNDAFTALASGSTDTRTWVDFVPDIGGFRDSARAFFNPTGQAAYDNVVSVVSTTLKDALGAAFTKEEGTRILNASYNPQLSPEQNLRRLSGIASVISATIEAKDARAEAFFNGEDFRLLPSAGEIFETHLAIYENVVQDKDRSIGIPATGSNVPATRIKSIKTGK